MRLNWSYRLEQGQAAPSVADSIGDAETVDDRSAELCAVVDQPVDKCGNIGFGDGAVDREQHEERCAVRDCRVVAEFAEVGADAADELGGVGAVGAGNARGVGELGDELDLEPETLGGVDGGVVLRGRSRARGIGKLLEERAAEGRAVALGAALVFERVGECLTQAWREDEVAALAFRVFRQVLASTFLAAPLGGVKLLTQDAEAGSGEARREDRVQVHLVERFEAVDGLLGDAADFLLLERFATEGQDVGGGPHAGR